MRKDGAMNLTAKSLGPIGIGYEGSDIDGFVERITRADVDIVADVRLTPVSRKHGFSKNALADALEAVGVQYIHLRALGNPKVNRPGFSGTPGESRVARAHYEDLLRGSEATVALDHLTALTRTHRVAVLCFEADEGRCHRDLVLSAIRHRLET